MSKTLRMGAWVTGVAIALGGAAACRAQSGDRPFARITDWFAPKTTPSTTPSKSSANHQHRDMEIQIELAWLADPGTFPYFLEARVRGNTLDVRGFVPNKGVREKALNIARVHCPFAVTDSLKEHSSLTVRPAQRTPEQLQSSVQTALREAFPKQHQALQVDCFPGGIVQVAGNVASQEQRLAVSQSLRRLHGCTSINNLTQVGPADFAFAKRGVQVAERTQDTSANTAKKSGFMGLFGKPAQPEKTPNNQVASTNKPGMKQGEPYETRGTIVMTPDGPASMVGIPNQTKIAATPTKNPAPVTTVSANNNITPVNNNFPAKTVTPTTAGAQPAAGLPSAAQLKKRLEGILPGRDVQVAYTGKEAIRIEILQRPGEDTGTLVNQVFGLRDLDPFGERVELLFTLPKE